MLIDIEVVDTQLDCNIMLGCNFMYAMKAIVSSLFWVMMFPYNGKVVTINQVTYQEPSAKGSLDNISS